jgi:hypothetical protein
MKKKLAHEIHAETKQKLLQKQLLIKRAIKDAQSREQRALDKAREYLSFILGDVVVTWIETAPQAQKTIIDSIASNVPSKKREKALLLIEKFSLKPEPTPFAKAPDPTPVRPAPTEKSMRW